MTIEERKVAILDKIMNIVSAAAAVEDNEKRITALEEETVILKEENAMLKEESNMLTECVLELSSVIYA